MKEKVFLIPSQPKDNDETLAERLSLFIKNNGLLNFIEENDFTAVKTHFGEQGTKGYVRPVFFKKLSSLLEERKCHPFLTETQTLYAGRRSQAVDHIKLAYEHGFTYENTGLPIIMSDGLLGDEELSVKIDGNYYREIKLASLIVKARSLIVVSHFTGHIAAGFGAAIKNLGMGCSSRRGKLDQHSTSKPNVKNKKCVKCGECVKWCPQKAIRIGPKKALIDEDKCIGCAECLAVCRFDAIGFNWSVPYEELQKKIVEHAWAVCQGKKGKSLFINSLTRVSKDCDCMAGYEKICPDIGMLVSFDPVALDAASIDLVEKRTGEKLSRLSHDIPYKTQIEYAGKLGFGTAEYELVTVEQEK